MDGPEPGQGRLITLGGHIFGTTYDGGKYSYGTIFKISEDGGQFQTLYSFRGGGVTGAKPCETLVDTGNGIVFGAAAYGGVDNAGAIFRLDTKTDAVTFQYDFDGSDGDRPYGDLFLSSDEYNLGNHLRRWGGWPGHSVQLQPMTN